jgi:hypothetical protein
MSTLKNPDVSERQPFAPATERRGGGQIREVDPNSGRSRNVPDEEGPLTRWPNQDTPQKPKA